MEVFSRVLGILGAVFIILLAFTHYLGMEKKKLLKAEERIAGVYAGIREKGMITASDVLEIKEAASLCGGSVCISSGALREGIEPETGYIYTYRDYFYLSDIEGIICDEGSFCMMPGDSVSISVEADKRRPFDIFRPLSRNRLSFGGAL